VQVDYNVVHLRTSLVQLFVLLLQNFEKVVQMIKLKRFGGAPNGYPFAPLVNFAPQLSDWSNLVTQLSFLVNLILVLICGSILVQN
jgi:hypothetical protein